MKKLHLVLALAILLAASAVGAMPAPGYAQGYAGYNYPPPPPSPYATPWVGPNTPWTYYNGDWFLNGVLHHFYGPKYGWAPYYAYAPVYIVRPVEWYGPRWKVWYERHPHYWNNFVRKYPHWRHHKQGRHYDVSFYNKYHRGQGGGWQKGIHGKNHFDKRRPDFDRRGSLHDRGPRHDGRR
jgi:hypothetical protein